MEISAHQKNFISTKINRNLETKNKTQKGKKKKKRKRTQKGGGRMGA